MVDIDIDYRAIAAGYQSPGPDGIDFAIFASTGKLTDSLADSIHALINDPYVGNSSTGMRLSAEVRAELESLLRHVRALEVTPWVVGTNLAGYLPESENYATLDYPSAVDAYRSELEATRDLHDESDCECCTVCLSGDADILADNPHDVDACAGGDTCEACLEVAHIGAYLTDEIGEVINGKYFRPELEHSFTTEDGRAHWLTVGETVTYGELIDSRE